MTTPNLIAATEHTIRQEVNRTIRLKPEYRKEVAAYWAGYIAALNQSQAITEDQTEQLRHTLRGALASAAVGIETSEPCQPS